MKRSGKRRHTIDFIFTIGLFCIFAISSLTVIIAGASVYKNTTSLADTDYNLYTPLAYLEQKVQAHDYKDGISTEIIDDTEVLCLHKTYGDAGVPYTTYIFCRDGYLKELLIKDGDSVDLTMGDRLMPLSNLHIDKADDNILYFLVEQSESDMASLSVYIHSKGGLVS